MYDAMRDRLMLKDQTFPVSLNILPLIDDIMLMWYGIWWQQPEDFGFGLGALLKMLFGVTFE